MRGIRPATAAAPGGCCVCERGRLRLKASFLSGTSVTREVDDIADAVLSYAEVKALAIGNPLIKKRVETANLLERTKKGLVCDSFAHEQNLVVQTSSGDIMITGCSHNGIVNIIDKYKEIYGSGRHLSHVIGGFHLYSKGSGHYESPELVRSLAETLSENGIVFHTCHCTGPVAYENMKSIMGDRLSYLRTGDSISL